MRLQVRFEVDVPDDMPFADANQWVAYEIGDRNDMRLVHPHMEHDLEPVPGSLVVRQM